MEVKSELLKVGSMALKPLNNFQSSCVNEVEFFEDSGMQINVQLAGGALICSFHTCLL